MRWSIPTLIQRLVDAGFDPGKAGQIVSMTYPETRGDTFYRWVDPGDPDEIAVGVYGLWNRLRGDRIDIGGTGVDDDARTIRQFYRLNPDALHEIVNLSVTTDPAVNTVVRETVAMIRQGHRFEPREVMAHDPKETLPQRLASIVAANDGAADYLRSLTPPAFGA